jgi:hypothetical protein
VASEASFSRKGGPRDEAARDAIKRRQEELRQIQEELDEGCRQRSEADDARRVAAERNEAWRERCERWKQAPWAWRESLLFDVLGLDRMTIGELTERIEWRLTPVGEEPQVTVYESDVRNLVKRMVARGQLDRAGEPFRGRLRYRYFRKRALEGPIADLERAYHDGDVAA